MVKDLEQTVRINLNFAAWFYTTVHGGDGVQDWRYRDAGIPATLALWRRGDYEGPDVVPTLAFHIAPSEHHEALRALLAPWIAEGSACWLVDLDQRRVAAAEEPARGLTEGELRLAALPGFRLDVARLFSHQG